MGRRLNACQNTEMIRAMERAAEGSRLLSACRRYQNFSMASERIARRPNRARPTATLHRYAIQPLSQMMQIMFAAVVLMSAFRLDRRAQFHRGAVQQTKGECAALGCRLLTAGIADVAELITFQARDGEHHHRII